MKPFQQLGKGVTFTGATSAPTPVQCVSEGNVNCQQYVISNSGDEDVFVGVGINANQATDRSVIPTATPAYGYHVIAGTKEVITGPANAYFSGITAANTSVVYVYPGIEN